MEKKQSRNLSSPKFAWIGYPDDLGVKNVNGRPGAKDGPAKFQEFFHKLNGNFPLFERLTETCLLEVGPSLEENYGHSIRETKRMYSSLNARADALLAVGGGHDYAYPWIKAIIESQNKKVRVGCLNIDAHFDLRDHFPVMNSGAPFRRLIEEKILDSSRLVEFGIQSHCNGPELWDYAEKKKISIVPFEKLRNGKAVGLFKSTLKKLSAKCDIVLISLDLDALSFAFAPGVSAPQAEGFTGSEIFEMLEIAGAVKKVTSLGIFELNPLVDIQNLTSRLTAQAAWHFLSAKLQ